MVMKRTIMSLALATAAMLNTSAGTPQELNLEMTDKNGCLKNMNRVSVRQ